MRPQRLSKLAVFAASTIALGACTTAELEAISAGLASASYAAPYGSSGYGYGYAASPYRPSGQAGGSAYGQFIGYNQCSHVGSTYTCDSNGDGYADMYGNTADGSYASSSLRVNGRGEAFTWGSDGWERNPAYDGPRQPDEIIIRDGD